MDYPQTPQEILWYNRGKRDAIDVLFTPPSSHLQNVIDDLKRLLTKAEKMENEADQKANFREEAPTK